MGSSLALPTTLRDLAEMAYNEAFRCCLKAVELGVVPDRLVRAGIRHLLARRAAETSAATPGEEYTARLQAFADELRRMPVAVQTAAANEQHYEVPTDYFLAVLGPHLKYSSCLFQTPASTLEEAEVAMLELCCRRAGLADGQAVLELGCGWGSLSLFMAAKYPRSRITAVSNSRTQKAHIDAAAAARGLTNLAVVTADVAGMVHAPPPPGGKRGAAAAAANHGGAGAPAPQYDRIVSVEMFEHMKNYAELLRRCGSWLRPGGAAFVHVFAHRGLPYHFEVRGEDDWMARHFFSGGTMPSVDLMPLFQDDLALEAHWFINGTHYARTLEAWLARHDGARRALLPLFERAYPAGEARKWYAYWRLFYLACAELFAFRGGDEWGVAHFLWRKRAAP